MLEKFLKGTYSFERQLGKNIVFSKDEIAIIHKRKAFWEKLVHIENLINLPYFSQINQSELCAQTRASSLTGGMPVW